MYSRVLWISVFSEISWLVQVFTQLCERLPIWTQSMHTHTLFPHHVRFSIAQISHTCIRVLSARCKHSYAYRKYLYTEPILVQLRHTLHSTSSPDRVTICSASYWTDVLLNILYWPRLLNPFALFIHVIWRVKNRRLSKTGFQYSIGLCGNRFSDFGTEKQ